MADIELVIKISEEDYESIKDDVKKFLSMQSHKVPVLYEAVNNGIQLPEGHGRLIDADALKISEDYDGIDAMNAIYSASTLVEADKTGRE